MQHGDDKACSLCIESQRLIRAFDESRWQGKRAIITPVHAAIHREERTDMVNSIGIRPTGICWIGLEQHRRAKQVSWIARVYSNRGGCMRRIGIPTHAHI